MALRNYKFPVAMLFLQVVFIIIFVIFVDYEDAANPLKTDGKSPEAEVSKYYTMFQDVHVMIFIGFGFLYTFLQRYGYSGVGFNLMLGAITVQWTVIIRGLFFGKLAKGDNIKFSLTEMIQGDFNAATVLISFGALMGKTGPTQLAVMVIFEVVFANLNQFISEKYYSASDVGGSLIIHAFGAYFGLAVSRVLYQYPQESSYNLATSYTSDLFSAIGTIFLWCFWPSFNGGLAEDDERLRAVMNTYISLLACVVVTLAISHLVDKRGKFEAVHLQNSSLAGGVVVGTCAVMPIQLWGALILGATAGALSVVGYRYITSFLCAKMKVQDPAGINNLHGMPGLVGGIAGAVMAAIASERNFGACLYQIFPEMAPQMNTTAYDDIINKGWDISPGSGRTAFEQGGYQMAAFATTIALALVSGAITGVIMRLQIWDAPSENELYDDRYNWNVPEQGFPTHMHSKDDPTARLLPRDEHQI